MKISFIHMQTKRRKSQFHNEVQRNAGMAYYLICSAQQPGSHFSNVLKPQKTLVTKLNVQLLIKNPNLLL